jgi:hypothetical protein
LVGEGERSVGGFDKRFGFKCEGGKVLWVSMIDSRTYSREKVLLMNVEKVLGFQL